MQEDETTLRRKELERAARWGIEAAQWAVAEIDRLTAECARLPSESGVRLLAWLDGNDKGASSRVLAAAANSDPAVDRIRRIARPGACDHPLDAGDFGRCVRLLDAVPELRWNMDRVAALSPAWRRLTETWEELEVLYRSASEHSQWGALNRRIQNLVSSAQD